MIFKSIFKNSKVSHFAETQGCPFAFAQLLRISQLYILWLHKSELPHFFPFKWNFGISGWSEFCSYAKATFSWFNSGLHFRNRWQNTWWFNLSCWILAKKNYLSEKNSWNSSKQLWQWYTWFRCEHSAKNLILFQNQKEITLFMWFCESHWVAHWVAHWG